MKEIRLGHVADFSTLPAEIKLDRHPYFLMQEQEGYRLVSRLCPHGGYWVELEDAELSCPMHGWSFDPQTGGCLNVPGKGLAVHEVVVCGHELFALFRVNEE